MTKFFVIFLIISATCSYASAFGGDISFDTNDAEILNKIEYDLFGKNNFQLSPDEKLTLTEQYLFGVPQAGEFSDRINFISKFLENSQKTKNGTITGYTPPVHIPADFDDTEGFIRH